MDTDTPAAPTSTEVTTSAPTRYDTVPYPILSFPSTLPGRLAVMARLFGLQAAPGDKCRVLELGCAHGGNIVPMAMHLPDAEFVGIDLAARQIEGGKRMVEAAGLKNITLRQQNILDFGGEGEGQFDYILCHGVFTWVAPEVQEKILSIVRQHLKPQGVAYISYNTYPGWHMRGMLRDMMVHHTKGFSNEGDKARQAWALMNFLTEAAEGSGDAPYAALLKRELEAMRNYDVSYFIHDFLAERNQPLYFHQFADQIMGAGLQYLGETSLASMMVNNLPPKVAEVLAKQPMNLLQTEQYLDFVRNRMFRTSLVCHAEAQLNRQVDPRIVLSFRVGSFLRPVSAVPSLQEGITEAFVHAASGAKIESANGLTKAVLTLLARTSPNTVPFATVVSQARAALQRPAALDAAASHAEEVQLASLLLQGYARGLMDFTTHEPNIATSIPERPVMTPLARFQASAGLKVTSLRHISATFDAFNRRLARLLDGTHDHAALLEGLLTAVENGELTVSRQNEAIKDSAVLRPMIAQLLAGSLAALTNNGYLQAG